jgi:hypothetical protein
MHKSGVLHTAMQQLLRPTIVPQYTWRFSPARKKTKKLVAIFVAIFDRGPLQASIPTAQDTTLSVRWSIWCIVTAQTQASGLGATISTCLVGFPLRYALFAAA